jgi:hypothetical protein
MDTHYWAWIDAISGDASTGDDGPGPADPVVADCCIREPLDPELRCHYLHAQSGESRADALMLALAAFREFRAAHPEAARDISGYFHTR